MKKIVLAFFILLGTSAFAQQKGIGYQAVIINPKEIGAPGYNAVGTPLANKSVCMSFQILNAASQVEYQETQTLNTDQFGMVNLIIGNGTKTGGTATALATVTWGLGLKTLVVAVNTNGTCSNYTEISRQALNYAPYALYAEDANVKDGAITTAKLADGSVTDVKVAMGINKSKVGLSNVDNTSDALKPLSTATQTALNLKANTADLTNGLATKVDKVTGKELSTNDYTTAEKTKLAAITGTNTGDQDLSSLATAASVALKANTSDLTSGLSAKVDKATGKDLSTNDYTTAEKTKLAAITGLNTGDQDLSALATAASVALKANDADVNTALSLKANASDVTSGLATKVDKVTGKELSTNDYTTAEKTKLAAVSGTNTGDQDLSALATAADVTSGLATKVDKITGKELSTNDYTTAEKTKLAAITGTNTGDQDLSALATIIYVDSAVNSFTGTDPISVLSGAISLNDNGITTSKIADNAITTTKIPDQTISTAKIANNAITITKLPSGATATTFLRGDGTWALPTTNTASTSIVLNGLSFERAAFTGDVTAAQNTNVLTIAPAAVTNTKIADLAVTGAKIADLTITTAKIADGAVTLAKQANISTGSLLGRSTAGSGSPEELTATTVKTLLALTKADVGLANVDNTSDLLKPISAATQTALDLKANLASPTFTGTPLAPTAALGTNNTQIATTAYVDATNRTIFSTRVSLSTTATPAPIGASLFNYYTLTAQAETATFGAPSGTPLDGNSLVLKIKASGAEMPLAWDAIYRGGTDISLPTITNKTMVIHFMYNTADAKWDMVGITNGI